MRGWPCCSQVPARLSRSAALGRCAFACTAAPLELGCTAKDCGWDPVDCDACPLTSSTFPSARLPACLFARLHLGAVGTNFIGVFTMPLWLKGLFAGSTLGEGRWQGAVRAGGLAGGAGYCRWPAALADMLHCCCLVIPFLGAGQGFTLSIGIVALLVNLIITVMVPSLIGKVGGWVGGWVAGWLGGWGQGRARHPSLDCHNCLAAWLPGWLAGWLPGWQQLSAPCHTHSPNTRASRSS